MKKLGLVSLFLVGAVGVQSSHVMAGSNDESLESRVQKLEKQVALLKRDTQDHSKHINAEWGMHLSEIMSDFKVLNSSALDEALKAEVDKKKYESIFENRDELKVKPDVTSQKKAKALVKELMDVAATFKTKDQELKSRIMKVVKEHHDLIEGKNL